MGFSRRLKDTLRRLRDLLDLPSVAENPDKEAEGWREEARELCYDLEDAIFKSSVTSRSSSADEQAALDQLMQRAMAALSEFNNLPLREIDCVDPVEDQVDASFLVGLEDPTNKIMELLDLPEKSDCIGHKVVSIVGLRGSGKSTLAAQVFDKIAEKFHCKARVFVTQKPNVKGILINLLREFGGKGDNLDHLHDLTLLRLIQEHVQDKRFLVLAEDICDENTWMVISSAFLHNNSGGRIIMTTRINDIASLGDNVYHICPLSEENSKLLLLRRLLGSEVCPSNMEDPLEKILEKCGGLPLAIIAMSAVLKKENSPDHWKKSYNVMDSADTEDSIKSMRRKLSVDYYELPHQLRICLLYLSIFPARHEIKRKRLVHGWIAQGLVQAKYGENVAEQATGYFNELININWIEPVNIKNDGQARACRVHNAILDFILYKSAEENFVTLLGSAENKEKKMHNLSIQNMQDVTQLGEVSHVRSLVIFGHFKQLSSPLKSDVLRVLDLENCKPVADGSGDGNEPLVDASSLLQLRYLSIRAAGINGPREEEIAKMQHLETLDLRESRLGQAQQLDITALQELVLLLVDSETTLKAEIENLKALEEVKYVSVSKHSEEFLKQLGQLAKLRVLGIHLDAGETLDELKKALALVSSLHKLGNSRLRSLYIDGNWDISLNLSSNGDSGQPTLPSLQKLKIQKWCYFNEVPTWIASLNNLETLRLGVSQMMQDKLAILGALPCLVDLFLDILEVHREEIIFEELTGFQYLKCLGISCRTRVKVTFDRKSVPCLEYLKLHIDIRDDMIPEGGKFVLGIEHLPSLTTFDVLIYCIRKTDPVVKDVKDAMQKEAGDSVTIEFAEKPERTDTDEGALMSQVLEKFENLMKDQIQKLEVAQIDVKELHGLLQDARCSLMMLLDDENPKHQVKKWTNTVRELCYRVDHSLSVDLLESRLQQLSSSIKEMERLLSNRTYEIQPAEDDRAKYHAKPGERARPHCLRRLPSLAMAAPAPDRAAPTVGRGMDMHDSDRYELVRDMGSGKRLMRDRRTQELVAVKYIERGEKIDENVQREILNHRTMRHPNIIRFKEVILTPTHLAIVTEYASGGKLFERIRKNVRFSEDEARYFFQQLITVVSYCHSMQVYHRDLKLENTLLDGSDAPRLKICEFGYSKFSVLHSQPTLTVGTPSYIAPEFLLKKEYDGKIADVWSCGVTLYVMLVGAYPFEDPEEPKNFRKTIQRILNVQYSIPDNVNISPECRHLISRIFCGDPATRITIPEICNHCWFLKNLPADLMDDDSISSQCEEPDEPMQTTDQIVQILTEATIPPACSRSIYVDDDLDDLDVDSDSSGEITFAL
ncbi:hypothetical protein ACP70R_024039 [Stipagrostis hirtigluma subsp. patula]